MTDIHEMSTAAIRNGSHSFATASRLLPPGQREGAVMLYAWCRHCDDAIDGQVLGHGQPPLQAAHQTELLAELRRQTCKALDEHTAVPPPFEALRQVVRRYDIPRRHPLELLDGFGMDVADRSYRTVDDTLDYAYHVAGVVGVMMGIVLGAGSRAMLDRACDLGIAFQLTNISRDVIDDLGAGRLYLPAEWLSAHGLPTAKHTGLTPEYLTRSQERSKLHRCAVQLLDCADPYYASARIGAAALPGRTAWAVLSALEIYRDIGTRLRTRGPAAWDSRISVPSRRKACLIAASLVELTRLKQVIGAGVPDRGPLWTRP